MNTLRLFLSGLLLAGALYSAGAATGPRCQFWAVRGRPVCWCYGAYGWRPAPALLCQVVQHDR